MNEVDRDNSAEDAPGAPPRARRPLWQRILLGLAVFMFALVALGALLYNFGGMSGSVNDPAMKQQYEKLVASGQVQPVERHFVIGIPGCTCHSTDPLLTEQHRNRRIKQCASCHARG